MSKEYDSVFSPYKRINDRINSIRTSDLILQRAKDALSKEYRGVEPCDRVEQLNRIRQAAVDIRSDAGELIEAVDIQIARLMEVTA